MEDIKQVRFEALAAYCRRPETLVLIKELRWLQAYDEAVLVILTQDMVDGDFATVLLARDLKERYRWVHMTPFFSTQDQALTAARPLVESIHGRLSEERAQGDEKGKPVDFFTPVVASEKINKDFATVVSSEGYSPAVELIKPMMRWYEDADGNFIEQFQSAGFDTRLWELYIFATLVESGYAFDKSAPMPDFCARNILGHICIEATTVNPSRDREGKLIPTPPQRTPEEIKAYQEDYMPIRYAGPLTAKLGKKYWEREHVKGLPLAFAIQDFHAPNSMAMSRTALSSYLYGIRWKWEKDSEGSLVITPEKITQHTWGEKVVPSGFFALPGSEHISAVIANASATISKFNRIGVMAGFGSDRVKLIRKGTAVNPDPNSEHPLVFVHDVNADDYHETWIEGMDVYHNPNALHPLDPDMLQGAAHHRLMPDGQLASTVPGWQPFGSETVILVQE